jgi:hypothetical protein
VPASIEGVTTTTAGFVGPTGAGPVDHPEAVTSLAEFEGVYGDGAQLTFSDSAEATHDYLWQAARAFFEQGGRRLYVQRVGGPGGERPGAAEYRAGLEALEDVDEIATVAAPGSTFGYERGRADAAASILAALVDHAERMHYRIAVLDAGDAQSADQVSALRSRIGSTHAALYWPWLLVQDPLTGTEVHLPPSGFVAGIYARNDVERGVWKAPANEVVNGVTGVETALSDADGEALAASGINWLRSVAGRVVVWGARTTSTDPEWKYVSVRRYTAYLEHSIDRGTGWAVFEPNGEPLWASVRRNVTDFLLTEFGRGALAGERPEDAFLVKCDRSNMAQHDLDNGRLVCLVGAALLRPAEFVPIRIGRSTAGSPSEPERTRYLEGKLLTAADFEREQIYHREKRRLHNRFAHGSGVVHGLEIAPDSESDGKLVIQPGVAFDPYGREILVSSPHCLTVGPLGGEVWTITLGYAESETEAGTVREHYQVRLRRGLPTPDAGVVLATVSAELGALVVDQETHRTSLSPTWELEETVRTLEERE